LLLDQTGGERLECLVEEVVLRVADRELQRVDLDGDILNVVNRRLVLASRLDVDLDGETFASEEDVGETRIADLGNTGLLVIVERDVTHVTLNVAEGELEIMRMLVRD
jgi:hypothetical protein